MKRILYTAIGCLLVLVCLTPVYSAEVPLVILHANDLHSQLEPFPASDTKQGNKGGILRFEALCRQVRAKEPNVLVFVSGDMVQGTPYFNFFKGEAEMLLLNFIKPTAVTLGNHEFDNGIDQLAVMLKHARFPIVCTNYDVEDTPLSGKIQSWLVVRCGQLRVGVVGANINLEGRIDKNNRMGLKYLDPIEMVERTALWLREDKKCDLVVCLSHLGYEARGTTPDDLKLAARTRSIDVIVGGHSHTLMREPKVVKNLDGEDVIINQCGKSGVVIGRLDLLVRK